MDASNSRCKSPFAKPKNCRLIGDIYDASLDEARWPDAVNRIRAYLGAVPSASSPKMPSRKPWTVHFMLGLEQKFLDLYNEKYFKINPIFPTVMFFDIEQKNVVTDVLPTEDLIQTRFAKEWIKPQNLCDFLFSTLEKSSRGCTVFMAMRHRIRAFSTMRLTGGSSLILPHVRRALLIGNVIETNKVKAATLADSLNSLTSAMFIVDGTGRIAHANISGNLMVSEANVLRAPGGRLRAADPAADQALLDVFTAAGGGDSALGRMGIAIPLKARDDERYVAHVLPLTSAGRRKAGASYGAVAAIFVRKAALDLPSPPVVIAQQFRLTQAELRVLLSVVEIGGVAEVAEVLGIAETTVKTHLRHVFEKTNTSRQADLVKLVAGYSRAP